MKKHKTIITITTVITLLLLAACSAAPDSAEAGAAGRVYRNPLDVMERSLPDGFSEGEFDPELGHGGGIPLYWDAGDGEPVLCGEILVHRNAQVQFENGEPVSIAPPDPHCSFGELTRADGDPSCLTGLYIRTLYDERFHDVLSIHRVGTEKSWYALWVEEGSSLAYGIRLSADGHTEEELLAIAGTVRFTEDAFREDLFWVSGETLPAQPVVHLDAVRDETGPALLYHLPIAFGADESVEVEDEAALDAAFSLLEELEFTEMTRDEYELRKYQITSSGVSALLLFRAGAPDLSEKNTFCALVHDAAGVFVYCGGRFYLPDTDGAGRIGALLDETVAAASSTVTAREYEALPFSPDGAGGAALVHSPSSCRETPLTDTERETVLALLEELKGWNSMELMSEGRLVGMQSGGFDCVKLLCADGYDPHASGSYWEDGESYWANMLSNAGIDFDEAVYCAVIRDGMGICVYLEQRVYLPDEEGQARVGELLDELLAAHQPE